MTISIAVASGKGGVGKTSIAVNLSLTLSRLGSRVVLFDADFGLANSHILLGVNPTKTAQDIPMWVHKRSQNDPKMVQDCLKLPKI